MPDSAHLISIFSTIMNECKISGVRFITADSGSGSMPFDKSAKGYVPRKRTAKEIIGTVASKGIRFIDLQFTDVPGRSHHVTIPNNMLEEDAFKEGVPKLDGSSIKGFAEI